MKLVYVDYNATTPLDEQVKRVFIEALELYANGSSMHEDGRLVAKKIETARSQLAHLINCEPSELVFTSGGSESNNTVFQTMNAHNFLSTSKYQRLYGGRKRIITTQIEHPCVLESARELAQRGFTVEFLPVDSKGHIDVERYKALLEESKQTDNPQQKVLLVSIMTANNEIGTIQPIKELCAYAHQAGALFHTDAVQAVGKIPVNVKDWDVDYLTISCHKIYGPKGVGALFVKSGVPLSSLIKGGHQEHGARAGTYNAPSIIAFGEACKIAQEQLDSYYTHTKALRDSLCETLLKHIPNIRINGDLEQGIPNTVDISFPGAEGEAILLHLDLCGIRASTGSACASGSLESSHVLVATGVGPELAHGSIRFSFGKYSTQADVDYICEVLPPIISRLRSFSTLEVS